MKAQRPRADRLCRYQTQTHIETERRSVGEGAIYCSSLGSGGCGILAQLEKGLFDGGQEVRVVHTQLHS